MTDQYDKAIEYLTANPDETVHAYMLIGPGAPLFQYAWRRSAGLRPRQIGCLHQIKVGSPTFAEGPTEQMTAGIKADPDIPTNNICDIPPAGLQALAKWQRRIDAHFAKLVRVGDYSGGCLL